MKKSIIWPLVAVAFLASLAAAQAVKIDGTSWMTVASEKAEFSLRMPKSSLVHVDDSGQNPRTSLYGFDSGVSIQFARTKNKSAKEMFRARSYVGNENVFSAEQKIDGVDVRTIVSKDATYRLNITAASDSKFYRLTITGKDKDDPVIVYVLTSIRIKGLPYVETTDGALQYDGAPIELSSLKTSKEFVDILKAKRPKWSGKVRYEPLDAYVKTESDKSVRVPIDLTALRPLPGFSPMGKGGEIRLKVVYKSDGTVGDITFYSDADRSILAGYAASAREMRFLPAIGADGKPVDFTKEFTMTFSTSIRGFIL